MQFAYTVYVATCTNVYIYTIQLLPQHYCDERVNRDSGILRNTTAVCIPQVQFPYTYRVCSYTYMYTYQCLRL